MKSPTRIVRTLKIDEPVVGRPTSWTVTLNFPNMPEDATTLTMRKFILTALEVLDLNVAYDIKEIKQIKFRERILG